MADAGFFKGTSADQDRRFADKEMKLRKSMKFPPEFDKKVDMRKVNLDVLRDWVVKKVTQLVGFEDEVVIEYALGLMEDKSQPNPDPRSMQINLTGFLTKNTATFMTELWKLLLECQETDSGVPRSLIEEWKAKNRNVRQTDVRAVEERDRRQRLDEIRSNERGGDRRGRGGGRGRGRGRGGGGNFDDRQGGRPRDSGWGGRGGGRPRGGRSPDRSPPPRRRSPSPGFSTRSSRSPSRTPPRRKRSRSPGAPSGKRSPSASPPRRLSRSPPPRARRRSPSGSPPPSRRRRRSPSFSPRDRRGRDRISRSPPPRRRRISPGPRSRSRSLSRTPPPRRGGPYGRRRSPSRSRSPPPQRRRRESPSRSPSRSPPRRSGGRRDRDRNRPRDVRPPRDRRSRSRDSSRTMGSERAAKPHNDNEKNPSGDDKGKGKANVEELKIKGQAEVERKKGKWDESREDPTSEQIDLERKESELKEKVLRNKVLRTRNKSNAGQPSSSSAAGGSDK